MNYRVGVPGQQETIMEAQFQTGDCLNLKQTWKAFTLDTGDFLLHIPTSTLFDASREYVAVIESPQAANHPEILADLHSMDQDLQKPNLAVAKSEIQAISLNVIQQCNLRCIYCYAGDGDYGHQSKMSRDTAKRAVDFFAQGKPSLSVGFFGGEPLLNYGLIEDTVEYCLATYPDCTFHFRITTNGLLLTSKHIEFFKRHNFTVTISYDGKALQAKQRPLPGCKSDRDPVTSKLEKYREKLAELKKLTLRSTVRMESIEVFTEVYKDLLNTYPFSTAYARVSSADPKERYTVAEARKLGKLMTDIVDQCLESKTYEVALRIPRLKSHVRNFQYGKVGKPACLAGLHYLSVSTSGEFFLCHRFTENAEHTIGNLEQGLDQQRIELYRNIRRGELEPCRSCWMRQWCSGGCFHENMTSRGSVDSIDPAFCTLQDIEMHQALRIYTRIRVDAPELLA